MRISSYVIMCVAITAVLFCLIIATVININKNNAKYLLFSLVVAFLSNFGLTMSLGLADYEAKIFWDNFKFVGVVFLPLALLLLYSSVLKLNRLLSKKSVVLMSVVPVVSIVIIFTNKYHHLFTLHYDFLEHNGTVFVFQTRAVWFYVHTAYSYVFSIFAFFLLLFQHLKKPKLYRTQTQFVLAAGSLGIVVSMMSAFRVFTDYGDSTILMYSIGMWIQFWGLMIFKPVKMIKIAKDIAFDNLQDPVLIFDNNNNYMDANKSAVLKFNLRSSNIKDIDEFFANKLNVDPLKTSTLDNTEICLSDKETMYFNVDDRKLFDMDNKYTGRVLLLNDITKIKSLANELELSASHDVQTGLHNRRSFREELKKLDKICPVSAISLITNNMKFYRKIIGYQYYEDIIKALANVLSDVCGERCYCARISDEEFVVLLQSEYDSAKETVSLINERINRLSSSGLYINISYGMSTKSSKSENIEIVCKTAAENMYKDQLLNAVRNSEQAVFNLKKLLYQKTFETEYHIERTIEQCKKIAQQCGITEGLENLTKLAIAHDIGINASEITEQEYESYDYGQNEISHAQKGYDIASSLQELSAIAGLILAHHEKYDGTGYPNALKGDEIPLFARIISVVDYYDKLVYGYNNKVSISHEEALEQIRLMSGTYFDPKIVGML